MFNHQRFTAKKILHTLGFLMILTVFSGCENPELAGPPHFDNSNSDRFYSSNYTADYSNTENLQGIWIVTGSHVGEKRYNCQLTLKENTTNEYTTDCELFTELSAPLIYSSTANTITAQRTVTLTLTSTDGGQYTEYIEATLTDASHITGHTYRDEYSSTGKPLTPEVTNFKMVRIADQYHVLGEIQLRSFTAAFNDAAAPYTESYPITRFYEYYSASWHQKLEVLFL